MRVLLDLGSPFKRSSPQGINPAGKEDQLNRADCRGGLLVFEAATGLGKNVKPFNAGVAQVPENCGVRERCVSAWTLAALLVEVPSWTGGVGHPEGAQLFHESNGRRLDFFKWQSGPKFWPPPLKKRRLTMNTEIPKSLAEPCERRLTMNTQIRKGSTEP